MSNRARNFGAAVVMDPASLVRRVPLAPHQLTRQLTPHNRLFVLAHLGLPRLEATEWRLEVAANSATLSSGPVEIRG